MRDLWETTVPRDETRPGHRLMLPPGGLVALLDAMAGAGEGDRVRLEQVTAALGPAGLGGAMLVPALIAFSPATVVFGVSTFAGLAIALISVQMMIGARRLWLPGPIRRMEVRRTALLWIRDRLAPPFAWLERRSRPRLTLLMHPPLGHVPATVIFVIGATMPVLEVVPLSATTGGAAVTLMVLGYLLDDGVLVAVGLAAAAGVALLVVTLANGIAGVIGL